MGSFGSLAGILFLATLVEALVEYLVRPAVKPASLDQADAVDWRGLVLRYAAAALGVALCLAYQADILALVGLESQLPYVGQIVTGVVVGRGANFVNDFVGRWLRPG